MKQIIIYLVMAMIMSGITLATITGDETLSRSAPSEVAPGTTFTLTYTAASTTGDWGVSIEEVVTGGCTFPSGNSDYSTVMLSDDGANKVVDIKAPSGNATCVFSGDYKFGEEDIEDMTDLTVEIVIGSTGGDTGGSTGGDDADDADDEDEGPAEETNINTMLIIGAVLFMLMKKKK